jgi:hypothetical protein
VTDDGGRVTVVDGVGEDGDGLGVVTVTVAFGITTGVVGEAAADAGFGAGACTDADCGIIC